MHYNFIDYGDIIESALTNYIFICISLQILFFWQMDYLFGLIEYSSEATASSPFVSKFDLLFNGYRIFLIAFIIVKFVILIGEIILSSHRMNAICKSIKYTNLF